MGPALGTIGPVRQYKKLMWKERTVSGFIQYKDKSYLSSKAWEITQIHTHTLPCETWEMELNWCWSGSQKNLGLMLLSPKKQTPWSFTRIAIVTHLAGTLDISLQWDHTAPTRQATNHYRDTRWTFLIIVLGISQPMGRLCLIRKEHISNVQVTTQEKVSLNSQPVYLTNYKYFQQECWHTF